MTAKLVFVDDEPDIAKDLSDLFKDAGFETISFTEVDVALSHILTHDCDLVCTGIRMVLPRDWFSETADKAGIELARRIKKSKPEIPLVALTVYGHDEKQILAKIRQAGFNTIIHKPAQFGAILDAIKNTLRKKK